MIAQFFFGLAFASFISLFSYHTKLLTGGGAVSQFVLGWIYLGLGGWQWTLPILVFFLTSSYLSGLRVERGRMSETLAAKGSTRDAAQVLANGILPAVFVICDLIWTWPFWYVAYLGSVAAATADTWGTEIGTLVGCSPRLVTNFRPVELGRSGAISSPGTFGGLAGATLVAVSGVTWVQFPFWRTLFGILVAGGIGSMVDSILGATVQIEYRCEVCGTITERESHCGLSCRYERGIRWLGNDLVNLFCTISGGAAATGFEAFHP